MDRGFSLIELMFVLAIIGILSSIAYPSYRNYITRAHRSDGQVALLDLANRMERFYLDHGTYQTATIGSKQMTDVLSSASSSEGWYILSITNATNTYYALRATPTGSQAANDNVCKSLTLNSVGTKGVVTNCW